MAKVNYRTCDICGDILKPNVVVGGFLNGYRIVNKVLNGLDICKKCMKKIRLLSIDKADEQKYVNDLIKNMKQYSNFDCQAAYCEGLEDALSVLSHRRLEHIEVDIEK